VIHHLVNTLHYNYGVREIWGIRGGYEQLLSRAAVLTARPVQTWRHPPGQPV
jgi:hypothetical protein